MINMPVFTVFYTCLFLVLSNSEEYYKMESSHLEKTPNYMEEVSKMLFVRKRVFDILPTKKPKIQIRDKFQEIDGETTRRKIEVGKHDRVFLKKMFMRQMKKNY